MRIYYIYIYIYALELKGIRSYLQFLFCSGTYIINSIPCGSYNREEYCQHEHIPFDLEELRSRKSISPNAELIVFFSDENLVRVHLKWIYGSFKKSRLWNKIDCSYNFSSHERKKGKLSPRSHSWQSLARRGNGFLCKST